MIIVLFIVTYPKKFVKTTDVFVDFSEKFFKVAAIFVAKH